MDTKLPPPASTLPCPRCGQPARWATDNPARPFCSERCKLIDLGAWASESHRIPGESAGPAPAAGKDQD